VGLICEWVNSCIVLGYAWKGKARNSCYSKQVIAPNYSKPSLIRLIGGLGWATFPISEQKLALKDKKEIRTQLNRKFNDISSADENKYQNIETMKRQYIIIPV
jgi:hypothetical protein